MKNCLTIFTVLITLLFGNTNSIEAKNVETQAYASEFILNSLTSKETALTPSLEAIEENIFLQRSFSISSLLRLFNVTKFLLLQLSEPENSAPADFRFEILQRNPFKNSYYLLRLCVLSSQAHPPTLC